MQLKRKLASPGSDDSPKKPRATHGASFKRHFSFGDNPIEAFDDFLSDEAYIADGSRPYTLPTVAGQHSDLKSITPDTLKNVICGRYNDVIRGYRIIDCRYPYEFEGGHVKNAENRYTEELIDKVLFEAMGSNQSENEIIIFHCEFSSKRGPKLCKYLRNKDRELNGQYYPKLFYPEIYILEGGYKDFYNSNMNLCEPQAYVPMLHSEHSKEVGLYRSRTCNTKRNCKRKIDINITPQKLIFSSL